MKIENKTKQQFIIKENDLVIGCSFRKAKKTNYYLGKVSVYSKKAWDNVGLQNELYTDIKLGTDKDEAREKLTLWVKKNILQK